MNLVLSSVGVVVLLILGGCAEAPNRVTYVDPGAQGRVQGTGIESQDVNAAATQAAQSIVTIPEIVQAGTPPVILITPVVNKSSSPVDTSLYTNILRDTLINNTGGKVRFLDRSVANVNQREQEMIDAGEVGNGVARDRAAATYDYILTAELQGIGVASSQGQSDYFRIVFKLVNRRSDLLVWTSPFQIKKEGRDAAIYR